MDGYRNIDDICSRHVNNMVVTSMTEWKKVLIPVQHMFPNCQVKYKTKCTDMKTCDKDKAKEGYYNHYKAIVEIEHEQILHNVNGYKIDPKRDKIAKKPEGFEDDIERAKKVEFE